MALNDLSTEQMIRVGKQWLNPRSEVGGLLPKLKRVQPWLDDLREAHDGLLRSQVVLKGASTELTSIRAQQAQVDLVHDRRLRGIFELLTALTTIAEELDLDPRLVAATREATLPDGLPMMLRGYAEEAAQADLVPERLQPEHKAFLHDTEINGKPLASVIERWLDSARQLGKLEDQRERVAATEVKDRASTPRERAARGAWINVVSSIRRGIDAHTELSAEQVSSIFQRLRGYEAGLTKDDSDEEGDEPEAAPAAPVVAPVAPAGPAGPR